ncbi:MAG: ATP-dependent DNA helicase RecG [Spirochaetaceae bacterium]|jgi:ATP-dependent DNA helicase RecG|nr:ATP-dependent DNA helicase RecG [Spirochaetaceae bacterium]
MFLRELTASPDHLKGAGASTVKTLSLAGLTCIADLLSKYPRGWEDRSKNIPLAEFAKHDNVCTIIKIISHDWIGYGKNKTLKVHIQDDTSCAVLVCFNRSFLANKLLIGASFHIWGHFTYRYGEVQSSTFEIEAADSPLFGKILPKYQNLKLNNLYRRFIKEALAQYGTHIENELPDYLIEKNQLLQKTDAVRAIHFPASIEELNDAKKTLVYEELLFLELMVGKRSLARKSRNGKQQHDKDTNAESAPPPYSKLQKRLLERLPFELTAGQTAAIDDINRDIDSNYAAARLLQGDVGSGKTLVSFMAALRTVDCGGQAAIMAPTELLARQHAENAACLLEPLGVNVAFLTGNIKTAGRNHLLKALVAGEIDMVVGTHALFSRNVVYKNLSLIVIDEQHRFGVTQRQAIMAKGENPDLLMMSATPIPRTLTFTLFGDMDISVIHDMPPGRKQIITHLAKESNEKKVYDFVGGELAKNSQAYFVYPLIETNEDMDLKDAQSMLQHLSEDIFPAYKCALIHSKLDEDTKRDIMDRFRKGEIRILVATSVVEVGVDVPNATVMVIEHAERFGLSALHQLRGRVGRGEKQSYCFLVFSDQDTADMQLAVRPELLTEEERTIAGKRLMTMLENNDGFVIAEKDLQFRGSGQIAGTEQSGFTKIGIADPIRDIEILKIAREDAFSMLEHDAELVLSENKVIAEVLKRAPPFGEVGV